MADDNNTTDASATPAPKAATKQAQATQPVQNSSGNIVKRNQTPDNLEISLPDRVLRVEPYGIVQMNSAEWASEAVKPYQNILK